MQARIDWEYRRWFPWCDSLPILPLVANIQTTLVKLEQMQNWTHTDIEQLCEHYIQSQLHKKHQTHSIELFYYQDRKGKLTLELEPSLQELKVQLSPLPDEAMLATLHELGRVTELAKLFSS